MCRLADDWPMWFGEATRLAPIVRALLAPIVRTALLRTRRVPRDGGICLLLECACLAGHATVPYRADMMIRACLFENRNMIRSDVRVQA